MFSLLPLHKHFPVMPIAKKKNQGQYLDVLQLESYLNASSPELTYWLQSTWKNQQQAITYKQLRESILTGTLTPQQIEQWQQDYSKLVTQVIAPSWETSIQAAANKVTQKYGQFAIDMSQPEIGKWIKDKGGQFIQNITGEQRGAVNALVRHAALSEDFTVDELARAIRPTIGLNERQSQAALHYYEDLRNNGATVAQAREAQLKYCEKMHRARAQTIAEFELASAYNNGEHMAIKQAQDQGLLGKTTKRWLTDATESVCKICAALDGITVDIDADFPILAAGMFKKDLPPIHPHCHCAVAYDSEPLDQDVVDDFSGGNGPVPPGQTSQPATATTTQAQALNLPDIPETPDFGALSYKGKANLGGTGEMYTYEDQGGNEFLFKPAVKKGTSTAEPFRAYAQEAGYKVQGIIDPDSAVKVCAGELDVPGKGLRFGAVQEQMDIMPNAADLKAWQGSNVKLDPDTIMQLQRENVTDWLLCNYDSHGGNFIYRADGKLIGVDKEQAFRFIDHADAQKLSLTFHPNAAVGESEPIYNTLYTRFIKGDADMNLQDTLAYIKRVEAISDGDYREIFQAYAESVKGKGQAAEDLLDKIVSRKQGARQAFRDFYSDILTVKNGKATAFQFADEAAQAAQTIATQPTIQTTIFSKQALQGMSLADLQKIGKNQKMAYWGSMTKDELITAISDPSQASAMAASAKTRKASLKQIRTTARQQAAQITPPKAARIDNIPTLSEALNGDLDIIIPQGNTTGYALMSDKTALEGLQTYVRKITVNGDTYYEISGKLTETRWKDAIKHIQSQSGAKSTKWGFMKSNINYSTGTIDYGGSFAKMGADIPCYLIDDNGCVFVLANDGAVTNARSFMGAFNLRIKSGNGMDAAMQIKDAFHKYGLSDLIAETKPEDADTLKKMRLLWQNRPKLAKEVTVGKISLDDAVKSARISQSDLDNLHFKHINDGYFTLVRDTAENVVDDKVAYVWMGVRSVDSAASMVESQQMISTNYRWSQGVIGSGASTTEDIKTGGADNVFTRIAMKKDVGVEKFDNSFSSGDCQIIINKTELNRTDWFAYVSDEFGTTRDASFVSRHGLEDHINALAQSYYDSNEAMFRKSISLGSVTEIRCRNDTIKTQLIAALKQKGIMEINGIPLDKFIKVGSKL